MIRTAIVSGVVAAIGSATVWSADYTVSTVDFPNATGTSVLGINNLGQVVGSYTGTGGFIGARGFIMSDGVFTPVGATMPCRPNGRCNTGAFTVNDRGEIVGGFIADIDFPGLFVQFGNDSPTIVQPPGYPNTGLRLAGLNERNVVAGCYSTDQGDQIFTLSGTQLVTVQLPVANLVDACAMGLNNWNQLVGTYQTSDGQFHGFLKSGPVLSNLDVPAAWGAVSTTPLVINDFGTVAGTYELPNGETHGFVWRQGQFSALEFPGSSGQSAQPSAINDRGEIVGLYGVPATVYPFYEVKAFVYRNGQISKLTLPGDGAAGFVTINELGQIAGSYSPSGCGNTCTEVHGFLATPAPDKP
jgi:uncharacterized membrane protein